MKIRVTTILAIAFAIILLVAPAAWAKNASVFNIIGGTQLQRNYVEKAYEESTWDWSWGQEYYPSTSVEITNYMPPYWDDTKFLSFTTSRALPGDYLYVDDFGAVVGLARYPGGNIWLRDSYMVPAEKGYIWEVPAHEGAHARVWFTWMRKHNTSRDGSPEAIAWRELVAPGVPLSALNTTWLTMPVESQAEHHRAYYSDSSKRHVSGSLPRTDLRIASRQEVFDFHNKWCTSGGTTTTTNSTTTTTTLPKPTTTTTTVPPTTTTTTTASSSVKFSTVGPYRVERGSQGTLTHWRIGGYYTGAGSIVWSPVGEWGSLPPPNIVATKNPEFYTWSVSVPAYSFEGPIYLPHKVSITSNGVVKSVSTYDWFDLITQPFNDVGTDDWDLYKSIWYVKIYGLFEGKSDGGFYPWDAMYKRHVYLVALRSGLSPNPLWADDYSLATRGEVRDTIPNLTFDSERWKEPINRGQVARLITRSKIDY